MAGNGTNCIRIVPYSAVQFSAYNVYKGVSRFLSSTSYWLWRQFPSDFWLLEISSLLFTCQHGVAQQWQNASLEVEGMILDQRNLDWTDSFVDQAADNISFLKVNQALH